MTFNPNWIVGKTVERVEMFPFDDGRGGTAHRPVVFFTDGTKIFFAAEETEREPGVDISYVPAEKGAKTLLDAERELLRAADGFFTEDAQLRFGHKYVSRLWEAVKQYRARKAK